MPIYAFHCQACGHEFDRLQKMSDPDPERCPQCAEPQIRRKLTAPSFRLAGSGWYETDFKKEGDKKRNLADAKNGSASENKPAATPSEAKTDTKKAAPAGPPASSD